MSSTKLVRSSFRTLNSTASSRVRCRLPSLSKNRLESHDGRLPISPALVQSAKFSVLPAPWASSTQTPRSMASPAPHVAVLGAGVIGLQAALSLLAAGYKITVIAEHDPHDRAGTYTSPWAGAHWRTHAGANDIELQEWDADTYRTWMELAREEERNGTRVTGLGIYPSFLYWPADAPVTATDLWWHETVSSFAHLPASALPPNTKKGVSFDSLTMDAPLYLRYLLSILKEQGGKLIKSRLPTHDGFAGALDFAFTLAEREGLSSVAAFVNATGIGARELVGDPTVFPTRGQVILVKGEAKAIRTWEGKGEIYYVLPRKGGGETVLGGVKEVGNWDTTVDDKTTEKILAGCRDLAPELLGEDGNFDVLAVQVGLRPSRKGGPRVETEIVDGRFPVVHSYGHSGAGYQNSIGNARKVVRLLNELDLHSRLTAKL